MMKPFIKFTALSLGAGFLTSICIRASAADYNTVWRKRLLPSQSLLMLRRELPLQPEIAKKRALYGTGYIAPDHIFVYSLVLADPNEKPQRKLWSRTLSIYEREKFPTNFQVLDATYDGQVTVLVYKAFMYITAEVVESGLQPKPQVIPTPQNLIRDIQSDNVIFTSATIQGLRKKNALSVVVKDNKGLETRFLWKKDKIRGTNRWIKEQKAAPTGKSRKP